MNMYKIMDVNLMLAALKSRWYICIISTLLFLACSVFYVTNYMEPVYVASATIFVSNDKADSEHTTATNIAIAEKLKSDCQVLATSNRVLNIVKERLPQDVKISKHLINVTTLDESRILVLSVTNNDATYAALIANEVAEVLITEAQDILKVENMQKVDHASVPTTPNTARVKTIVLGSVVVGLLFGIILIFLLEKFDKKVQGITDIEAISDLPILALIPKITGDDILEKGQRIS